MTDISDNGKKAPWHLWAIGGVGLLWNAFGCFDYVMTQSQNAEYLAAFTPEQLAHWNKFPIWMDIAWALGVWGAVAGSVLLLMRNRFAVHAFAVSLLGLFVSLIYNFGMTNGAELMGMAGIIMTGFIVVAAVLLLLYARAMARRGVVG